MVNMITLTDVPLGSLVALILPENVLTVLGRDPEQATHIVVGYEGDTHLVIFPLHRDWRSGRASLITPDRVLVTQEV